MDTPKKISVQSVTRNTLAKQVVDKIVELLVSGQLKAGDKLLTEMELMEELQVSRPVLREALSSLETLGVITRKTREGTYISNKIGSHPFSVMLSLAHDNLPAIVEARMALELGMVTLAAEKMDADTLAKLKKTIDIIEKSENESYAEADFEFHRLIAMSADNPIVEGMLDSLIITHKKIDSAIKVRERERTLMHHQAIYSALEKRDPAGAFAAMYEHLNYVRAKVLKHNRARNL